MRGKIKQSSQARVARNPRNPVVMYERVPCTSLRGFWKLAFPSHRIPLRSNPLGMRTPWTDRIGHPNRFINWEFSRLPICEYAIEKTSGTYVQRSARLVTPHRPGKRRAKKKRPFDNFESRHRFIHDAINGVQSTLGNWKRKIGSTMGKRLLGLSTLGRTVNSRCGKCGQPGRPLLKR